MRQDEDGKITENKAREARRRRDHDDLNNEMAGREVGRIARFLPEDAGPESRKAKRERHAEQLSRLVMMMQDAEYAALYRETVDIVQGHAAKAEAGLEASQSALSAAGQALETVTDKAAKLHPDGSPIFRDKDGNAVCADGTPLSPDEADSVVWPDNAPSYEEYTEAKRAYADAQARLEAWKGYQAYLGSVQDRLNDPDDPYSAEELEEVQQEVRRRNPEATAGYRSVSAPAASNEIQNSASLKSPDV